MPQVQVIQPIQQQPKRLRVAAYARVSTKSNEQLHSMSVQTEYYEDLIQKNPNWEFVGVYADEGISGTSIKHRAELNRLMEDCRAGMIDRILVKSASRMARNAVDLLTIIRELKSIGVAVQFEKEQFDTDSATGEMMLSMMCAIAQEESLSISKNMKWGIRKTVQYIFEEYTAGKSLRKIAENMTARKTPYHEDSSKWNQNMVSRVLANEIYCGNEKYLPIITEAQYRLAEKIRQRKAQTYSTVLQPFRQDVQCGCCGERLYWRPKTEQWFCRQCGMWTKPIPEKELSDAITIKLEWIQRHSEVIHPPTTQRNVQSIEGAKLTREIQTDLLETEPNADALIAKILHRAELEYQFCSAGDADPASLQMQKACAEYKPTDDFPHTFYKGIVSNVSLYRDTHIEFKLRNGQTV